MSMTPFIKRRFRRLIRPAPTFKFHHPLFPSRPQPSWVITCAYILFIFFITFGPFFRLNKFYCQTNTGEPCPDYIVPELSKKRGELAYLCQTTSLIKTFHHTLPQADTISIEPKWPNTLVASITWQPGIANLQIPASTSAILVGKSGQLITLTPIPDPSLPTIIASSAADLIISDHLSDSSLQSALELIKQLEYFSIPVYQIVVVSPIEIKALLKNGYIAIFTSLRNIYLQVNTLHLILSDPTMNAALPIIDVRYDRPALKPSTP